MPVIEILDFGGPNIQSWTAFGIVVSVRMYVAPCTSFLSIILLTGENSSYTEPNFFSLASREMLSLVGTGNALSVVCDIIITAALSYYLHSKRTGFERYVPWVPVSGRSTDQLIFVFLHRTNSMINRLIIYAINRGTLTA